jgi:hypothetical protein
MRAPRHIIPTGNYPISIGIGALSVLLLVAGLAATSLSSGLFWELGIHRREFGGLAYLSIHPLFWLAGAATVIVGGIFGWLTALALRR